MPNKYPGQTAFYKGKVRNVYTVGGVMVAETSSRISAFDHILPFDVENKGAVLNLISAHFMKATSDIVPNCLLATPTPETAIWLKTEPFKIEVIVRGYNTGSFYRNYYKEKKVLPWDYKLDFNLKKDEKFRQPLITPTTKADAGHDEDISVKNLIDKGLATEEEWRYIKHVALKLFAKGQEMADTRGLILVDTKYEFGKGSDGTIYLIDEVHTPDSSRYWYKEGYKEALAKGEDPKALSKEFVRQYLMDNGFTGEEGQTMPKFSDEKKMEISDRYEELYEQIVGNKFTDDLEAHLGNADAVITALVKIRPQIEGAIVSIVMGSKSDLSIMQKAAEVLTKAGIPFEVGIVSAHRTPDRLRTYANQALNKGIKVIIAGAGGAAHLPGMVAANTILPVIGVPVKSSNSMIGLDSLLSIGQMPAGVPVATMAIDGAANAGLLALQIVALNDGRIKEYLQSYKRELKDAVDVMQIEADERYYFSPAL